MSKHDIKSYTPSHSPAGGSNVGKCWNKILYTIPFTRWRLPKHPRAVKRMREVPTTGGCIQRAPGAKRLVEMYQDNVGDLIEEY